MSQNSRHFCCMNDGIYVRKSQEEKFLEKESGNQNFGK